MRMNAILLTLIASIQFSFSQDEIKDPKYTEIWGPVPSIVSPGENNEPPSDALILFDGTDLSMWVNDKGETPEWEVKNGNLTVVPHTGGIRTRHAFGDCQLHIEWKIPEKISGNGQGRGNSGVFLMGRYEIQILDSYQNRTYSNGQAGSVYKDKIPLVNACLKPGEWQVYDIVFTAPVFSEDGSLESPAFFTVFHNGVLIHNNVKVDGTTDYIGEHSYKTHPSRLPLGLQDHGNPISFRNIWIREL